LRRAACLCSLPLGEILKKAPEDASQEVGPFEPREMSNLGKLNIAGRRDDLGELTGHSGRTRIALTMHDQRGYPQVGKLLGQRTALYKVIGIVAKELVDPEIDMQAADKQLPDQLSRMCVVSDVGGPGQFTVGPFGLVKFGPCAEERRTRRLASWCCSSGLSNAARLARYSACQEASMPVPER